MDSFVFEHEVTKIKNPKTRMYLNEAISCYHNGCYRAAITTLYSVVIYDLLHKMLELKNVYQVQQAEEILNDIKKMRKENERSPQWEDEIVKRVSEDCKENPHKGDKTYISMLDSFAFGKYYRLKNDRHKCAHPAHDGNYDLRSFNQDEVRAHIRNMIEYIFTKDALSFSNYITLVDEDIDQYSTKYQPTIPLDQNVLQYFFNRYFNTLIDEDNLKIVCYLADNVWGEIKDFRKSCLSFYVLLYLMDTKFTERGSELTQIISDKILESDYIQDHIKYEEENGILTLDLMTTRFARIVHFFFRYPDLYDSLPESEKDKIKIKSKENINYYLTAYFVNNYGFNEHLNDTESLLSHLRTQYTPRTTLAEDCIRVSPHTIANIYSLKNQSIDRKQFHQFIFRNVFAVASCYTHASEIMRVVFPVIIDYLDRNDMRCLVAVICQNGQFAFGGYNIYGTRYPDITAYIQGYEKKIVAKLGKDFDFATLGHVYVPSLVTFLSETMVNSTLSNNSGKDA